jgi:hypothetical protein
MKERRFAETVNAENAKSGQVRPHVFAAIMQASWTDAFSRKAAKRLLVRL